jgi:hypothetical protein
MSRGEPQPDCQELAFGGRYPVSESAEVALEDYVRVVTRARAAEARRADADPSQVCGVHVCGPATALDRSVISDVEAFARDLALRSGASGLGWS